MSTGRCLCDTREVHPASECIPSWRTPTEVQQEDLRLILQALDLHQGPRPYSPHAVVHRDILPAIDALRDLSIREQAAPLTSADIAALRAIEPFPIAPVDAPGCRVRECPMRAQYCTQHRNRLRLVIYATRKAAEAFRYAKGAQ